MDLYSILELVSNPDSETRKIAEINLKNIENQNFKKFTLELSFILSREDLNPEIRRLSGLILKNKINSFLDKKKEQTKKKNFFLNDSSIEEEIKKNVIKVLNIQNKFVRRTGSQVLAKIFQIELANGQTSELISYLISFLENSNYQTNLYCGILETVQFLCQEINYKDLSDQFLDFLSENVWKLIFPILNEKNYSFFDNLKVSALTTLLASLELFEKKFKKPENRNFFFKTICIQLTDSNSQTRKLGFEIFDKIIPKYYEYLDLHIPFLFEITLQTLKNQDDDVSLQAIEFWSSLAEKEFEINIFSYQALHEGRVPFTFSQFYIIKTSHILPQFLFKCLIDKNKNQEKEEWDTSNSAGICINLMSQAAPKELIFLVNSFVELNLQKSACFSNIESAFMAFVAVFDGIGSKMLYGKINFFLFLFIGQLDTSNYNICSLASWTLGKICLGGSFFLRYDTNQIIRILFSNFINKPQIENISWSLNELFMTLGKEGFFSWCFEEILLSILNALFFQNNNKKRSDELFEILGSLILNSTVREKYFIFSSFPLLFLKFKEFIQSGVLSSSFEKNENPNHLIRIINIIVQKYGKNLNENFCQELFDFIEILIFYIEKSKNENYFDEELLICIGTFVHTFKKKFSNYFKKWIPFLLRCISNINSPQTASLAIGTIGDLCRAFGTEFRPYLEETLDILIEILQNNQIDRDIKPLILSCFGDIAFTTENNFSKYFVFIIPLFKAASSFIQINLIPNDPDSFDCKIQLKESILEGMSSLIQNKSTKINVDEIFEKLDWILNFLRQVVKEDRSLIITQLCIGLIGDLSLNFFTFKKIFYREKWIQQILFEFEESNDHKNRNIGEWVQESIIS